jgi:uncharacterized protein (DUF2384 family)
VQPDLVDRIFSGEPSAKEALFRLEYRIRSEQNLTEAHEEIARQILESFSRRDREALIRFYLEEQVPEQICREMSLTEAQFRLIKSRAKAQFRELSEESSKLRSQPSNHATKEPLRDMRSQADTVLAHARETFGSEEKTEHWLRRPNHVFQGKTPLEMIESDPEQVEIELTRIDHGVYI